VSGVALLDPDDQPPADRDQSALKSTVRVFLAVVTTLLTVTTVWTVLAERPTWLVSVMISLAWGLTVFSWMAANRAMR
jgi:hypothetical protein